MESMIHAQGLSKHFGKTTVLDDLNFTVERGRIVGLIGHNGAGKTTVLKCILGLATYHGQLQVMGMNPQKQRAQLMEQVCFIADTAILPGWLNAQQAISYLTHVHPKFNAKKAAHFLEKTNIPMSKPVAKLSKGMVTQLHLALVMAIDVPLLVLDEPTLGLDILYRKEFYSSLLNDYFDMERTIIVTTHQVEEIEALLTDLIFIRDGKLVLNKTMDELHNTYRELHVLPEKIAEARAFQPIYESKGLGKTVFLFEDVDVNKVAQLGDIHIPSISDIFVAKMQKSRIAESHFDNVPKNSSAGFSSNESLG